MFHHLLFYVLKFITTATITLLTTDSGKKQPSQETPTEIDPLTLLQSSDIQISQLEIHCDELLVAVDSKSLGNSEIEQKIYELNHKIRLARQKELSEDEKVALGVVREKFNLICRTYLGI